MGHIDFIGERSDQERHLTTSLSTLKMGMLIIYRWMARCLR
uniref:Uncharacterized protein n=1 Tax=Arundo donax TaxID=35708 RepID=A0A0A9CZD9_ARUDO